MAWAEEGPRVCLMGGDRGACEVRAGAMPSGEDGLLVEVTTSAAKVALAAEAVLEAPGPGPGLGP